MKHLLLILFLCLVQLLQAQKDSTSTKPKNHSIGLYTGVSAFQSYSIYHSYDASSNTWQTIIPSPIPSFTSLSNLFSFTYKYKKHEIIPVLYLATYLTDNNKNKPFLLGGSLSYLYHFSQKRAHLFVEGNFQTLFYTANDQVNLIEPYNTKTLDNNFEQKASIQTYMLNAALGIEVKLWPLTYLQFACGSGAYYIKGKPVAPASISSQWGFADPFQNIYPGIYGFNWYGRLSIVVRGLNF